MREKSDLTAQLSLLTNDQTLFATSLRDKQLRLKSKPCASMMRDMARRVINVASVPHRSPFRYPGGKTWLVPYVRQWLKSLRVRPAEFMEPFAGGGIVGLSMLFDELTNRLTLVELDEQISSVWKAMLSADGRGLASRIL